VADPDDGTRQFSGIGVDLEAVKLVRERGVTAVQAVRDLDLLVNAQAQ